MGYRSVDKVIIGTAPVIVDADANVGFGQVCREGVAIYQQRSYR